MALALYDIETSRLQLRKADQAIYDELFTQSEATIREYLGLYSDESFEREVSRYRKGYSMFNKTFLYFFIVNKATGKVIGWCGYHTWYKDHSRAEIGYMLYDNSDMKKGIMTEAIIPTIAFGFNEMRLNRIEAFVGPDNEASLNIMKKMGFKQEGYLKQHYRKGDIIEDSVLFALLKDEYRQL